MKTAVFFDVDGTIINGQTQRLLISYLYRQKKISLLFLLKIYLWFLFYKIGIVSSGISVMTKSYKLLKGIKVEEFRRFLSLFFKEQIKPRIYLQAIERINYHKERGDEVVLLSKSIKILIDIIKDYLNLPLSIATTLEIKNGIFTGEIDGPIIHGEEKVNAIKKLISEKNWDLKKSYAYGDHFSDLSLLKTVGYPIVVNPDKRLKKEAEKYNWTIYFWKL